MAAADRARLPAVGIDIGGTRTKSVALTREGDEGLDRATHVVHDTPDDLGAGLVDHVRRILRDLDVAPARLGVVVPGLVDDRAGQVQWAANVGLRDLDLRALLTRELQLPVAVGHDVRAGLLGEHRFGAARGVDDVLFVPLGTGLAGALLTGGRLVTGSVWTGEIGHVVVDPEGPPCGCGGRGCLEAVASAGALGRLWSETTGARRDARDLLEAVGAGDSRAQRLLDAAVGALAGVLAPVVAAAGTERVILGGGLAQAGERLREPVDARLRALLPGRTVQVRLASLGDRAAALGALVLGQEQEQVTA